MFYKLISDVFLATAKGETDYSVIPVENTIEGSVSLHMDWLIHEVDLPMQAEWIYPSVQNLIANPGEFTDGKGEVDYSGIVKSSPIRLQWPSAAILSEVMPRQPNLKPWAAPRKLWKSSRTIPAKAGRQSALSLVRRLLD